MRSTVTQASRPLRDMAWSSIRILRRFTVADLLRTLPRADTVSTRTALRRFLRHLAKHGYICEVGPRVGGFRQWRLTRYTGPAAPRQCNICRKSLSALHHL